MKRVGLDLQAALDPNPSGLGYYVASLHQALITAKSNQVEVVGLEGSSRRDLSTIERFRHDRWEIDRLAQNADVSLIHQPAFSCPKSKLPVIWTLHDLRQLTAKEKMSIPGSLYWKKYLPYSQRYADLIVCTSASTKRDALKYFNRPESDYQLIPIGLPNELSGWQFDPVRSQQYGRDFQINQPYFISVGTIQPVKNFPFLIDVFAALRREFKLPHQLVIVGKKGWDYDNLAQRLERHHFQEGREVIITGYATNDQKWSLIRQSEAFLFPSLYEGFGIPPLEAQFLGTPVISSDTSSLPDVVGRGGLFCSPTRVEPWLAAYNELSHQRSSLIQAGHENVKRFDWHVIAQQWLDLYQKLA